MAIGKVIVKETGVAIVVVRVILTVIVIAIVIVIFIVSLPGGLGYWLNHISNSNINNISNNKFKIRSSKNRSQSKRSSFPSMNPYEGLFPPPRCFFPHHAPAEPEVARGFVGQGERTGMGDQRGRGWEDEQENKGGLPLGEAK